MAVLAETSWTFKLIVFIYLCRKQLKAEVPGRHKQTGGKDNKKRTRFIVMIYTRVKNVVPVSSRRGLFHII